MAGHHALTFFFATASPDDMGLVPPLESRVRLAHTLVPVVITATMPASSVAPPAPGR